MQTIFDGICLDEEIDGFVTLDVVGRETVDIDVVSTDNVLDGSAFKYKRIPLRTISVMFIIKECEKVEMWRKQQKLTAIINRSNANDVKKLVFSDECDKYFNAMSKGVSDVSVYKNVTSGTITFLCFDPYKYSFSEKEFHEDENSDGTYSIDIVNNGNADAEVDFYAKVGTHDNGFFGFSSDRGIMRFGVEGEAGTEHQSGTIERFNYDANSLHYYIDQDDFTLNTPQFITKDGVIGVETVAASSCIVPTSYGVVASGTEHGAGGKIAIPNDVASGTVGAKDFVLQSFIYFWNSTYAQTGTLHICVSGPKNDDNQDHPIIELYFFKATESGNDIICNVDIAGDNVTKQITYQTNSGSGTKNKNGSFITFNKIGNNVTVNIGGDSGGAKHYNVTGLDAYTAKNVTVVMTRFGTEPSMERNAIEYIRFYETNVDRDYEIDNRYRPNDSIYVDGTAAAFYVNGTDHTYDEVAGSEYITAAADGVTRIYTSVSDFCTPRPKISARIRERWL